jgi:hypothetical protein
LGGSLTFGVMVGGGKQKPLVPLAVSHVPALQAVATIVKLQPTPPASTHDTRTSDPDGTDELLAQDTVEPSRLA